ncbi:MAG: recombination regulator RecX [Deferribacterales bacterium]
MINEILAYALRLLNKKDYFVGEIKEKLHSKFPTKDEDVEKVIVKLTELKYLNDDKLLEQYIINKYQKGWGEYLIKKKLFEKGVDVELSTIKDLVRNVDNEKLYQLVKERYIKYGCNRERTVAYFFRKGYDYGEINKVMTEVITNEGNFSERC